MNYAQLQQRAEALASLEGWNDTSPAPDWASLVNLALEEFSWEGEYVVTNDTITLAAGTSIYALPLATSAAAWKRVTDAALGTSILQMTDPQILRRQDPNWFVVAQATPTRFWMPSPGNIQFYPTPSAVGTVTVRGYRADGPLSAVTDSPACPGHFHEGIALLAAWRHGKLYATAEAADRVAGYRAEAERIMGMLAQYLAEQNGPALQRRVSRPVATRYPFGWRGYIP